MTARSSTLHQLDVDACMALLRSHHVGRVAINDAGGPMVVPVNYVFERGAVLFRTDAGAKLDAAEAGAPATFEIDEVDHGRRAGWSVVVRGRLREVTDGDELDRLMGLPLDPFVGGDKAHYVELLPTSISGRRIALPVIADDWFLAADLGNVWYGRDGDDLLA